MIQQIHQMIILLIIIWKTIEREICKKLEKYKPFKDLLDRVEPRKLSEKQIVLQVAQVMEVAFQFLNVVIIQHKNRIQNKGLKKNYRKKNHRDRTLSPTDVIARR